MRRLVDDLQTAMTMPRIDIVASDGSRAEDEILLRLNRPHPRYRIVRRKTVGVALMPLDDVVDMDAYLANHRYARRRVNRAVSRGHEAHLFAPTYRRTELFAIHRSVPER